jgi:hypothetical protein
MKSKQENKLNIKKKYLNDRLDDYDDDYDYNYNYYEKNQELLSENENNIFNEDDGDNKENDLINSKENNR